MKRRLLDNPGVLIASGVVCGNPPIPAAPTLDAIGVTSDVTPNIVVNPAVTGATQYQFQVSTVSNFASTVADVTQVGTTYTVSPALAELTDYYVRVRALNAGGSPGAWSDTLTFIVGTYTDTFNRADGAVGGKWLGGATWAIATNALGNTPALAATKTNNGEYTSATTGWTAQNGATLTQRDSATTPGTPSGGADNGCLEITNGGTANAQAIQAVTVVVGSWYRISGRMYSPSANTTVNAASHTSAGFASAASPAQTIEDTWQTFQYVARATATSANIILRCQGAVSGDKTYFDSLLVQELTLAEVLSLLDCPQADVTAQVGVTLSGSMHAGLALNWDDPTTPTTGVLFYTNGIRYYLDKCVAGTWTNVTNNTITYAAGKSLKLIKSGDTYTMFYGDYGSEAQIGTPQTITSMTGTYHGVFNTGSGTTQDPFALAPSV